LQLSVAFQHQLLLQGRSRRGPCPRPSNGDQERQGGVAIGHNFRFLLPPLGRNPRQGPERSAGLASHWSNRVVIDSRDAMGTSVADGKRGRLSRIEQYGEHSVVPAAHADDERPPIPGLAKRRFTNAAPEIMGCSLSTDPVMNSSTPPRKEPCYFLANTSNEQLITRGRTTSTPNSSRATATRQPGDQAHRRSATE
jgi:hypothetical protein